MTAVSSSENCKGDGMDIQILEKYDTKPNKKNWRFCVGSGHALLALRTDYTRQLKFIHDELGIERVRFHGIFHDDMSTVTNLRMMLPFPGTENFRELNFRACGIAYDNVLAAGMKPFVEISFMPKLLARNPDEGGFIYYRPCASLPADDEAWKDYLKQFIFFLEHRYGAEEVRSWYFEIWNEPDLGATFFHGGDAGYFHLYRISAEAIKEADPEIRVGGPATSGSRWIEMFRRMCEENHVPLDFLSTHQYAGDPFAGVGESEAEHQKEQEDESKPAFGADQLAAISRKLAAVKDKTFLNGMRALLEDKSETTEIPADMFRRNSALAREQAGAYPLFYTEWGSNAIMTAATNDTAKTAAYIVKNALAVEDNMDGSSYWCFSDIFEEWHPFVEPFHGGFGLLNQDGIPKPGFWGFKLLSLCGEKRIVLPPELFDDEIGAAAFSSGKEMQILLFRQHMKNDENADRLSRRISVEMKNPPAEVTVMKIDQDHGNPRRVWQEKYLCRNDLNQDEIADITDISAVREERAAWSYENGFLHTEASLGVNDVWLILIKMECL